jgi:hypothetical protein
MDDTQFVKNSHQNRNRIKTPNGLQWLTVPIKHQFGQRINDVEIDFKQRWRENHWKSIVVNYSKAEFFKQYSDFFESVYKMDWTKLADLNIYLIEQISRFLGINDTKFSKLSELQIHNDNPTQRLIDICENVGATNYIIGNRAKDYMEEWRWEKTKVTLEYYEPSYCEYPQLYGDFKDNCSIVDLLFNHGPNSCKYIWGDLTK